MGVMHSKGTERTILEISAPVTQAYLRLSPSLPRIRTAWHKMLERYEPCREHVSALSGLHLAHRIRDLRAAPPQTYRLDSEEQGRQLARLHVPIECASAAVSLYVESCLPYLMSDDPQTLRSRRSLTRWGSVYQFLLLVGYSRHLAAERNTLEDKVGASERRYQDSSVQLGDAYEKERRRLAQDLHDEIGHDLIVLKLYTQMIARDLRKGDMAQLRRKLGESVSLIKHALQGVRHLVFDLGPAVWNEQGFVPAVRMYSRQFTARTGIRVRFDTRRLHRKLPARYETALYKALQGSLANVAAHSGAHHARITLSSRVNSVVMKVEDDGKGFNVGKKLSAAPRSYGLRALRDRIELLGGTIQIASKPARKGVRQGGTTIEFHLPLQDTEDA
jgi:signal transduction histidine kinase